MSRVDWIILIINRCKISNNSGTLVRDLQRTGYWNDDRWSIKEATCGSLKDDECLVSLNSDEMCLAEPNDHATL